MKLDLASRRTLIGGAATAIAILASVSSSSRVVFAFAALAFGVGWAVTLVLIRTGNARARPEGGPIALSRRRGLAAALGVGFWILVGGIAENLLPGAGKDIVGVSLLACLGGLVLGIRFSALGRTPIQ